MRAINPERRAADADRARRRVLQKLASSGEQVVLDANAASAAS